MANVFGSKLAAAGNVQISNTATRSQNSGLAGSSVFTLRARELFNKIDHQMAKYLGSLAEARVRMPLDKDAR